MRNIFDQYQQPENRLTHALASTLDNDRQLVRPFLKWLGIKHTPANGLLHISQQSVPGEFLAADTAEDEADRRGLPDMVIFDEDGWAVLFESKFQAKLTADQIRRHKRTAERCGYEGAAVVALVVDVPANAPAATTIRTWRELYEWFGRHANQSWFAGQFVDYLRTLERQMIAREYAVRGTITMFDGLPFGDDLPYTWAEAKRRIRLLGDELQTRKDLHQLGVDPKGPERPDGLPGGLRPGRDDKPHGHAGRVGWLHLRLRPRPAHHGSLADRNRAARRHNDRRGVGQLGQVRLLKAQTPERHQAGRSNVRDGARRQGSEYGGASSGPLIPWTPITNKTAALFAQRLANTSRPLRASHDNDLAQALATAGVQIAGNGVGSGYRSILLVTEHPDDPGPSALAAARDNIIFTQQQADQINFLAVAEGPDAMQAAPVDRLYGLSNAVESAFQVPSLTGTYPLEDNLGFCAELDAPDAGGAYASYFDPNLGPVLERIFQRMSFCPGDFNRNGMLDGNDTNDFISASQQGVNPYADWNFDGLWDGHIQGEIDFEKFDISFNVVPLTISCP